MKKKILFLSPLPPPHYGSALSSEMCLEILRKSKDFKVKNIKLNLSTEMRDVGKLRISKFIRTFNLAKKIRKKIKHFKPDLVYIVPATSNVGLLRDSYLTHVVTRNFTGPIVLHLRSRILEKDWENPILKKALKNLLQNKKVILLGKQLKNDLKGIVKEKDMFFLPNAIPNVVSDREVEKYRKERKKHKRLELLFLSNLDRTKGWTLVLDSCNLLKGAGVSFHCSFVGEWISDEDKEYFFEFVNKYSLKDYVSYLGKKVGSEKFKVLSKTDILIFPTMYPLETFGRVIIEGMMFGIPVIASGMATIPDIIKDGKTGFILKKNTPEEICKYVNLLKNDKLREKMGINGRKRFLEEFELKNYAIKFIHILGGF